MNHRLLRPRSRWAVAIAVPGALLLPIGLVVTFGSVETDAPASQQCTGSAAIQWTRTLREPCHTDALDQFIGGTIVLVVAVGLLAWAVVVERRRHRAVPEPVDPSRTAWANPETVRSLHGLRCRALLVGVPGFVALAAFVWMASWLGERAEEFAADAARTSGTVERADLGFWRGFADALDVEYVVDGATRHATVYLDDTSPNYDDGETVTVLYDESDPDRATIEGEDNDPPTTVWPMIVALVGGGTAFGTGLVWATRYRRWRRVVRSSPWRPSQVELYTKEARTPIDLAVIEGSLPLRMHTAPGAPDVPEPPRPDGRVPVWVAGDTDHHDGVAIGVAGGRVVGGARRSRSRRRTGRWAADVAAIASADGWQDVGSSRPPSP